MQFVATLFFVYVLFSLDHFFKSHMRFIFIKATMVYRSCHPMFSRRGSSVVEPIRFPKFGRLPKFLRKSWLKQFNSSFSSWFIYHFQQLLSGKLTQPWGNHFSFLRKSTMDTATFSKTLQFPDCWKSFSVLQLTSFSRRKELQHALQALGGVLKFYSAKVAPSHWP